MPRGRFISGFIFLHWKVIHDDQSAFILSAGDKYISSSFKHDYYQRLVSEGQWMPVPLYPFPV